MDFRKYQRAAMTAAVAKLQAGHRQVLLAHPTGSGKTATGIMAAYRFAYRSPGAVVQWLAYQQELADHARDEHARLVSSNKISASIVFEFATIQSQMNRPLKKGTVLIVVDEAHHLHSTNKSLKYIKKLKPPTLGLSATPRRTHQEDGWVLAHYVHRDELTPTFLATPVPVRVATGFTPYHVGTTFGTDGGEFDAETYRALDQDDRNEIVADFIEEHIEKLGRTLVFVHTKDHCERLAHAIGSRGLVAAYVHGDPKIKSERKQIIDGFRSGAIQVLVNARLIGEGVDVPELDSVVLAVPTLSDIRFSQMIGRGSRKTKRKTSFYIIDFVDNLENHYLKLMDGRYLFDGVCSPTSNYDPNYVRFSDVYRSIDRDLLEQPYLEKIRTALRTGLVNKAIAAVMKPEHVETALLRFSKRNGIPLALDESRPLEVPLVHQFIFPLLTALEGAVSVRKEMGCSDGTRCDIVIHGNPSDVIEFSTQRVDEQKAKQLLGYLQDPLIRSQTNNLRGTLVAVAYKGNSLSRTVTVNGQRISFMNWNDYLTTITEQQEIDAT